MSQRDELALTIHTAHCLERVHSKDCTFWHDDHVSADAVLAAGYWKPRTIATAEELDALPDLTVIIAAGPDGEVMQRRHGSWAVVGFEDRITSVRVSIYLPATVLYDPEDQK